MTNLIHRLRGFLIAFVALGLTAGLAFGAQPSTTGLANAAAHAGKVVPVQATDETTDETTDVTTDVTTDETTTETTTETESDSTDTASNCTTDPTTLTPDELAAMTHGSIVCWAAQQTTWPAWFANHGAWVRCWAQQGKSPDAASCTVAPTVAPATHGHGHGRGHSN